MTMIDDSPSEENSSPKTQSSTGDIPVTEPANTPASLSPENANKSRGVTGLLRDIFRRNASQNEDENPVTSSTDKGRPKPSNIDPDFDRDPTLSGLDSSSTPLSDNLLADAPEGNATPGSKVDSHQKPPTSKPGAGNPPDDSPAPNRGVFKSFVTGVLKNTGALPPPPEESHEGAIDDRLSSIFSSETSEEQPDLSWEEQFLASIAPSEEEEVETHEYSTPFYDPNAKYLKGNNPEEDEEDDYLFQEWIGFTKSLKNRPENPVPKSENPPEISEPDPFIQLPAHSQYENDEDALFEERIQDFKDKNSFLYTPQPEQETISLDEMRQVVLEDIHTQHNDPGKKKHVSYDKSSRSFKNLKRGEMIALVILAIVILAVAIAILYVLYRPKPQLVTVQNTPTVFIQDIAPSPVGLQITGGWYFPLSKSTMVDGRWKPKGAEWLEGSDIRRIVTLPWNKQLEAAIKTLVPGDEIELNFNNSERIAYQVDKVQQLSSDQINAGNETVPSLLIILYDENSRNRWTVSGLPKTN